MIDWIRSGDKLEKGGSVISASATMTFDGKSVARKGDAVVCEQHTMSQNHIVEGDEATMDCGLPIARHGHKAACGCRLISSLL